MARSYTGKLLVATPKLVGPEFARAVVLVIAHDDRGAFGVVLNRPLPQVEVAEHVPGWARLAAPPSVVFLGGPVEQVRALGLGRVHSAPECAGWTPLDDHMGLVDLTKEPGELDVRLDEIRVFTGYAGWGAGQLDGEVDEDAWFVVDPSPGDAFTPEPDRLWRAVLRRQPGKLAMYAYYPSDPSSN